MSEIPFVVWFPLLIAICAFLGSVAFVASQIGTIYHEQMKEQRK